ncbi:hypothetical protein DAPPUDRAFT_251846 [Daphnia pulex]|uniref:Uncharacterized protein n=1 Tax=Daphnia pulex TaxID=6669 RepID=E9H1H4_DAPPU|nr:hypothetical protein DAPPUDRAFT_251846 [Daphnia pulex]|eukprot:EFX74351.1 hypothetical protein DAPPUDRAFT_251846 [Daphnia pulex]
MSPDVFPHGETHNVPVMASQSVWPRVTANKSASYAVIEEFFKANERGSVRVTDNRTEPRKKHFSESST